MNKKIIKILIVAVMLHFIGVLAVKDEAHVCQVGTSRPPRRVVRMRVRRFIRLRPDLQRRLEQLILQRAQIQFDQVPPMSELLQDLENHQMQEQQQNQEQCVLPSFGELMEMIGYDQQQVQEQPQNQEVQQEHEVLPSFDELLDSIGQNSSTDQN